MIKDKKQLIKLLSFMSTFDGCISTPKGKKEYSKVNSQFIMNMLEENLDYVEWVSSVINTITGTRISSRKDYNTDGCNRRPQVRLESCRHPIFSKLKERIYIDSKKVIDPHMLNLLDAEALAIIFMTDGGSHLDIRYNKSEINLHTKGFSYFDNLALSKAIYDKLGIQTKVNKHYDYHYLRIKSVDHLLFINTVLPYMCKSFLYKIERIAPAFQDGDIVWPVWEHTETSRDD